MVKGGTTPALIASSGPCETIAAAAIGAITAVAIAVYNHSSGSGAEEATPSATTTISTTHVVTSTITYPTAAGLDSTVVTKDSTNTTQVIVNYN